MECEGSHFSTGGQFSPPGLGVMTRFLQTKNDPFGRRKWTPVTFLRRKMTGGRFSMGVVIRRYTCSAKNKVHGFYYPIEQMTLIFPMFVSINIHVTSY